MGKDELERIKAEVYAEIRERKRLYMQKYRASHPEYVQRERDTIRAKRHALKAKKAGEING